MSPTLSAAAQRGPHDAIRHAATLALLTGSALLTAAADQPADPKSEAAPTQEAPLVNWLDLAIGGTIVNGNDAAFQQRLNLPSGLFGGSPGFHYEQEVATNTWLKVDGRGLFGAYDYRLTLDLRKADVGFLRAGISEFRTYYDGSGGYSPAPGSWRALFDDDLHVDRREFWAEAGLRRPKFPHLTLRYERQEREGKKGSTSWGPTTTSTGSRNLTASFWDLDEIRDIFRADARHTIGKTTFDLGFRYERQNDDDTRNARRFPGEGPVLDRYVTDRQELQADLLNVHAASEIRFRNDLWLTLGYAFTDLDTDLSGYRAFGTGYDPDLAERLPNPNTYQDLAGGSRTHQHIANLNLFWSLKPGLAFIPSFRLEKQDVTSDTAYGQPAQPFSPFSYDVSSDRGLLDLAEGLELRYTGLTNLVLYARGDWLQGRGDLDESWNNVTTAANLIQRSSDDERHSQKYSAGATWYPARRFSLGAGYYHKARQNDFDHRQDSTPNTPLSFSRYPAYLVAQEFTVDDVNVRVTWRPFGNLTLVARYDLQLGTVETQADQLDTVGTADITSQILSGSVSWVPWKRLFVQTRLSYVQDETESPVTDVTDAIQNAENTYWTANATAGLALNDDVDLEASYFYYRADDYSDHSAVGLPYGAGLEENGACATLTWRISRHLRWLGRYTYFDSRDDTSGGHNDFDAHLLYTSVQYRF